MTRHSAASSGFAADLAGGSASVNECIAGIVDTGAAFVALANRALGDYQLSAAARHALAVLDGTGEPLSPTEIARHLMVTTSSVTSLLDTLESRGLVERRPDPHDRRRLRVAITPAATRLVRQFAPEVVMLQSAVMAGIPEAERRRLIAALRRIRTAIAAVDT